MSTSVSRPAAGKRRMTRWLFVASLLIVVALLTAWWVMIRMPGQSFHGPLPDLDDPQTKLRDELYRDVEVLSLRIGERNARRYDALVAAARYVEEQFSAAGYNVERQDFTARDLVCTNLVVEIPGTSKPDEIVVIGAHYDSALGTPGANDNGSGTAAMLALARRFTVSKPGRTLRFVAFTNEETPFYHTRNMGSWVYAQRCSERKEKIVAALSLETIGYYSDQPNTQKYPEPFDMIYPSEGNFIGIVGNVGSRKLVHQIVGAFRDHAQFPSEGAAIPAAIAGMDTGVDRSDQWSFWQFGYPGVMITDTAPFRYPYYHHPLDTPDKIDFERMARVVGGLEGVVQELVK